MKIPIPVSRASQLRWALMANAAFSLLTGTGLILFARLLAPIIGPGIEPLILIIVGGCLLPFGAFTAWLGTRKTPDTLLALGVSLADLGWVLGSGVLLGFAGAQLSAGGIGLVSLVALCVLGFAVAQLRGIATYFKAKPGEPGSFRLCMDIRGAGDAGEIWNNLADFGEIARFAPMLGSSRMRAGQRPAEGAIRECVDLAGRRWSERCTLIDPATRRLTMEFLAQEPGFPFPFRVMTGGWHVQADAGETVVRVWWEGMSRFPVLDPLVLPLLANQARRQFPVILRRMGLSNDRTSLTIPSLLSLAPC